MINATQHSQGLVFLSHMKQFCCCCFAFITLYFLKIEVQHSVESIYSGEGEIQETEQQGLKEIGGKMDLLCTLCVCVCQIYI